MRNKKPSSINNSKYIPKNTYANPEGPRSSFVNRIIRIYKNKLAPTPRNIPPITIGYFLDRKNAAKKIIRRPPSSIK
jgi:hypothetical protein